MPVTQSGGITPAVAQEPLNCIVFMYQLKSVNNSARSPTVIAVLNINYNTKHTLRQV
jgi:hypothetical protein